MRSAGTENSARIRVTEKMIQWAEVIFVMEKKHKQRLVEKFPDAMKDKRVEVLDIPDDYQFLDPELAEMIRLGVQGYFGS